MPEVLTQVDKDDSIEKLKQDRNREKPAPEHVIEFIYEEMEARGWDEWELARRMGGDAAHNKLSLEILDVCREVDVLLGEDGAEQMSHAFGTGAEIWLNLDKTWRDHQRTVLERARLGREVVEAAGLLRRLAAVHARYVAPEMIAEAATRYREAERQLFVVVDALAIFEAKEK